MAARAYWRACLPDWRIKGAAAAQGAGLAALFRCRLCAKVALAVFALILAVECVLLVPSARRFERNELERLADHAVIAVEPVLLVGGALSGGRTPVEEVAALVGQYRLAGLALYGRDGSPMLRVGEHEGLAYSAGIAQAAGMMAAQIRRSDDGSRTDIAWRSARAGEPLVLARLDSTHVNRELWSYLLRIVGLVAIIVLVVTSGTMIVLHRIVLRDLLRLRTSTNAAAIDPARSAQHTLSIERDDELGEVVQAFDQLLRRVGARTAELELANRDLDSFGYSVSHDLRAPLGAINGFAYLLRAKEAARLSPDGAQLLAAIEGNADRMVRMLEGLLEFSRLGRAPLAKRQVAMGPVAREVVGEIQSAAGARPIHFRVAALPDCSGDAVLLRQVWANLLGNAVKYSRHRDPAVVEVGFDAGAGAYEVRDNGAGFDMENAGKLFGVFERLHGASEFEGTGVGLAIAQRIVEKHGGRIWAQSAPGKGATFRFTLAA